MMRTLTKSTILAAAVIFGLATTNANAVPVEWTVDSGGNGHFYDAISWSGTWAGARADALSQTHIGQQGYLVNFTSAAEQAFFLTVFPSPNGIIGAHDLDIEGKWVWSDGPEAGQQFWQGLSPFHSPEGFATGYANWAAGEPNQSGEEDVAQIHTGGWNDYPASFTPAWLYYIEYNAAVIVVDPPVTDVPEPMTLSLLGAGLAAGLSWVRRRRG